MDDRWRLSPTWLKSWPENVSYILFVDESGTPAIPRRIRALEEWRKSPQYLSLAGVMMDRQTYFGSFRTRMVDLKNTFWPPDGMFDYPQGRRRVVLHSRDIRRRIGPFQDIDIAELYRALDAMVKHTPFTAFCAVLDLRQLEGALPSRALPFKDEPYSLGMQFILERYAQFLRTKKCNGLVVLEARGRKEDFRVLNNMVCLLDQYPHTLRGIDGIFWVPKWAEWDEARTSFGGLELADLIAYPVARFVQTRVKDPAFEIVEPKLFGYPRYENKGLKVF